MPSSVQPALIEGWLLAVEAKRQEMELQLQAVQQQHRRDWLLRQAPLTGSLPAATPLSDVGTPLEAEVPAGHPELPQQQHLEQPVVQGPVRNRFRKSPSRGPLDVGSECEAVSALGGYRTRTPSPASTARARQRADVVHRLQQRLKELYAERGQEQHAPPPGHLVGEDQTVSCRQPPEQSSVQPLALGHSALWWEFPLARQVDLLHRVATLPGLDVGADPKEPAFPAMAVCD